MLIAHLPAGYILSKKLQKLTGIQKYLAWGLLGAVFPDFDLFWFYFIDNRHTFHHEYFTHLPVFWAIATAVTFSILYATRQREYIFPAVLFFAGILSHLILDTLASGIEWLYPFSDTSFAFVTIPSTYGWWVLNYLLHGSFLIELLIVFWAVYLFLRSD